MSNFQSFVIGIFIFFIVLAVLIFTGVFSGGTVGKGAEEIVLWGTIPSEKMISPVEKINAQNRKKFAIVYEEKDPETYERELVESLAAGTGPDLFFLAEDSIVKDAGKVAKIPYTSVSERTFKDTFVEEGELYMDEDGIIALPVFVDPLVLYWNRDIFSSEGIAAPPKTWSEVAALAPVLTKSDTAANISRSAVALGEFSNIPHAKDILAAMMLQAGNGIVEKRSGELVSVLARNEGKSRGASSLRFYTQFADPRTNAYSWNRSLPDAKSAFIAGDAAMYFGYASELSEIAGGNPHLNFDIAPFPFVDEGPRITRGKMEAIAVARTAARPAAFSAAYAAAWGDFARDVAKSIGLPPARRDLLSSADEGGAYEAVFRAAAVAARGWLDPDPAETERIFRDMIEGVTSGRFRPTDALSAADVQMKRIINNNLFLP